MAGAIALGAIIIYLVVAIVTGGVGLAKDGEDRWERFHERWTFQLYDLSREPDDNYTTPDSSGDEGSGTVEAPQSTDSQTGTITTSGSSLQGGANTGSGSSIPVTDGTTLPKGSAAVIRIINGNTATVCYTSDLPTDVYIGTQDDGDIIAAWSTATRQPWGWIESDAIKEANAIRNGSLSSMGVTIVDGPKPCS